MPLIMRSIFAACNRAGRCPLAVLRVVVLGNAVVLVAFRFDNVQRPGLAVACTVAMVAWTAYTVWAYLEPSRRQWPLLVADLALAVSLIAM